MKDTKEVFVEMVTGLALVWNDLDDSDKLKAAKKVLSRYNDHIDREIDSLNETIKYLNGKRKNMDNTMTLINKGVNHINNKYEQIKKGE